MAVQIQIRRGTAAQWTATNPTLAEGELGLETDTSLMKIGDGDTPWTSLAYAVINGTVADGFITNAKIANNAVSQTKLASDLSGVTICTSTTRPASPFEGQTIYETNTDLVRSYNGTSWVTIGPATPTPQYPSLEAYGVASGGTSSSITVGGINYTLLSFTSSTNLTVSTAGWFDLVLVGGGGGGGNGVASAMWSYGNQAGSGGGGGEVSFQSVYLRAATYSVTIGSGGGSNVPGANTTIRSGMTILARGGANGGSAPGAGSGYGGGSPGGHFLWQQPGVGFAGAAYGAGGGGVGGGGGGMGGAGSGASGGSGIDISTWIGGATANRGAGGAGGSSGGAGGSGSANTGDGGAGGGWSSGYPAGGTGGSGAAYVRFRV